MVTPLNYKNDARRQQVTGAMSSEGERLAAEIEALEEHIRLHDGAQPPNVFIELYKLIGKTIPAAAQA